MYVVCVCFYGVYIYDFVYVCYVCVYVCMYDMTRDGLYVCCVCRRVMYVCYVGTLCIEVCVRMLC